MIPLSVLDLAPVPAGQHPGQALRNTVALAKRAEALGYRRYWLAEHHNMVGIASAATAVVIGLVAGNTRSMRVGSGGIMLPNHAPLVIAEQFGTLEAFYPGRIDLGLGRAPGTDQLTAYALRRTLEGNVDDFPRDVQELQAYFAETTDDQHVKAVPGAGLNVPIWILGSSLYGAQLAAALGLPYAFASHFAPAALMQAIELYRDRFQPSEQLDQPYVMLRSSHQLSTLNLRHGRPGLLPPPVDDFERQLSSAERAVLEEVGSCSFVGDAQTVRDGLEQFVAQTSANELIIASQIYDPAARIRSYEITANIGIEQPLTSHTTLR